MEVCDHKKKTVKSVNAEMMDCQEDRNGTNTSDTSPKSVVEDITSELSQMMENKESVGEPQTMDIATVHAMFKRLEAVITKKDKQNPSRAPNSNNSRLKNSYHQARELRGACQSCKRCSATYL